MHSSHWVHHIGFFTLYHYIVSNKIATSTLHSPHCIVFIKLQLLDWIYCIAYNTLHLLQLIYLIVIFTMQLLHCIYYISLIQFCLLHCIYYFAFIKLHLSHWIYFIAFFTWQCINLHVTKRLYPLLVVVVNIINVVYVVNNVIVVNVFNVVSFVNNDNFIKVVNMSTSLTSSISSLPMLSRTYTLHWISSIFSML